jgi:hypothetical protein
MAESRGFIEERIPRFAKTASSELNIVAPDPYFSAIHLSILHVFEVTLGGEQTCPVREG